MTALTNDTICALATAPGGALAVIRISGPEALTIANSVCSRIPANAPANTIHYAHIVAPPQGTSAESLTLIDEVLVSVFHAPHSYTGEDSVEISCHGSRYIVQQILDLLIDKGCRMAEPGEYTMRAYLNGKLDLSQAEAVADLIASTNSATHQIALSQLRGKFSTELARLREQLLKLTSLLELELDFSDHEDLEFADRSELLSLAITIEQHISRLAQSFKTGQAIKQGVPVAIIGKTNVGKSTLLNRLLKDDRAIVSDIHGTTRDTIEDTVDINGVTFRFIDTAGIRQTTDAVEQIGIERTFAALEKARIILWILDDKPTESEIAEIRQHSEGKRLLIVQNKIDITTTDSSPLVTNIDAPFLKISAKSGYGITELESAIYTAADIPSIKKNDIIITSARHYDALIRANDSIRRVIEGMGAQLIDENWSIPTPQSSIANDILPSDLLAEDLRQTISILSEITGGAITTDEVLGNIFQHFCVGK